MLERDQKLVMRKGIYYELDAEGKIKKYQPWLGDLFARFYDRIMERSIFPRKFKGNIKQHFAVIQQEFKQIEHKKILDVAAGSGNLVQFLDNSNHYAATDISPGLLKVAARKLKQQKFPHYKLYICDVVDLPFSNSIFDLAVCNLSLNFFPDLTGFIEELHRILKTGGRFFCSVPLPEKKQEAVRIRGKLYSQSELQTMFEQDEFRFKPLNYINGCLLYFWAEKQ